MAELPIPNKVKKEWERWSLRVFILLSLFLQLFLILFAPFRKRTAHKFMILLIWSGYLLADYVANFVVGQISSRQRDEDNKMKNPFDNADLLAFWSPFLLVHLGGPDTITAFALEDNQLWLRHLLGLLFQLAAAAYVFFQTLPHNKLITPTLLLFAAGIIKYAERTRALYLASLDSFRNSMLKDPDPGPNYAKLMEEFSSKKDARLPVRIEMIPEPDPQLISASIVVKIGKLSEVEVVQYAYQYFKTFKGLIVDLIFSFRERNETRKFFLERTAKDAFSVIEVELNFIYEVLFTKVVVVHSWLGYIFRGISFAAVMIAFVLFNKVSKAGFHMFDVAITYILLWGAITLDSIAIFMLIFSDWTITSIKNTQTTLTFFFEKFLKLKKSLYFQCLVRRWSGSIPIYNLINVCLRKCPRRIKRSVKCLDSGWLNGLWDSGIDYIGLKDFIEELFYVEYEKWTPQLWNFIFAELHSKAEIAESPNTANEICSAKGDWILRNSGNRDLLQWVDEVEYDASLLLWHIATDLCYYKDGDPPANKQDNQKISKLMSDYMLYLLVMQPTLMSAVAGIGQIRFRDTCAEAQKFFSRKMEPGEEQREACEKILEVNTKVRPVEVKGDRSKSVLFDACMLAKELEKVNGDKWEIISKVWVEMMSYAASHCRANAHAQQVSKGGELITFVWLLMAHFGLGQQFQIKEGHARAKLIVGN